MLVRKVDNSELVTFGELTLNTIELRPSYKDVLEVYNFTGEKILFATPDGAVFELPHIHNPEHAGKLVIRREVKWADGGKWLKNLEDKGGIDAEVMERLKAFYLAANERNNLLENGGHHTCRYDTVLELPEEGSAYNAAAVKCPSVIFGRANGMRSVTMMHEALYGSTAPEVEASDKVTIGVVVSAKDYASAGYAYLHIKGMYICARKLIAEDRWPGTLICLATGNVIIEMDAFDDHTEALLHDNLASAVVEAAKEFTITHSERDADSYDSVDRRAKDEDIHRTRKLKHTLNLEEHEIKKHELISKIATAEVLAEDKIASDNFKSILNVAMGLVS